VFAVYESLSGKIGWFGCYWFYLQVSKIQRFYSLWNSPQDCSCWAGSWKGSRRAASKHPILRLSLWRELAMSTKYHAHVTSNARKEYWSISPKYCVSLPLRFSEHREWQPIVGMTSFRTDFEMCAFGHLIPGWIIFLVETPYGLAKNSNLQNVSHFIFINFVEYWLKKLLSTLSRVCSRRNSMDWQLTRAVNHPTNTTTMVVPFANTAAWWWQISPPHPREPLYGRGWLRAVFEGYIQFSNLAKKKNYLLLTSILFQFYSSIALLPPKRWHYIPHAITPCLNSSPISPPPCPSIFGWLLCGPLSVGGHLRPHRNLLSFYFDTPFAAPNDGNTLPHALKPPRASSLRPLLPLPPTFGWLLYVVA